MLVTWVEYQPGPHVGNHLCWGTDRNCNGVLWADYFSRFGSTSFVSCYFSDIRSPGADADSHACRCFVGVTL